MTTRLVTKTLYQKRKLIIWWFFAMALVSSFTMYFYPTLKSSDIGRVFGGLPDSLQKIAGNASTFTSLTSYISQEIFQLRAPLLTIILSIIIFASLTVGEERRGLLETQITLPLSRSKILAGKLLSSITVLLIASVGTFLGVVLGLGLIHDHYSLARLSEFIIECLLLSLDFGLITFFLSSMFGAGSLAVGLSTTYAFASYLVSTLAAQSLVSIQKFSLFHYYQDVSKFNIHNEEVLVVVGAVLILLSFVSFSRRDINT